MILGILSLCFTIIGVCLYIAFYFLVALCSSISTWIQYNGASLGSKRKPPRPPEEYQPVVYEQETSFKYKIVDMAKDKTVIKRCKTYDEARNEVNKLRDQGRLVMIKTK